MAQISSWNERTIDHLKRPPFHNVSGEAEKVALQWVIDAQTKSSWNKTNTEALGTVTMVVPG